ncbi:unnamed protein product, partial [Prorocentrum cordatum]
VWEKPVDDEAGKPQSWRGASHWHERGIFWAGWYDRSFPLALLCNRKGMARRCITLHSIKQSLCGGMDLPQDQKSFRVGLPKAAADSNFRRMLRLSGDNGHMKHHMLGNAIFRDKSERIRGYGFYMTTNSRRLAAVANWSVETAVQEIKQHCRQAAEGHSRTA